MNGDAKPTEDQKLWLARVLGPDLWRELAGKDEFLSALDSSIVHARRIALQYLAEKERTDSAYYRK